MRFLSWIKIRVMLALAALMVVPTVSHAADVVGVVLMHGKRGTAEDVQSMAQALLEQGYLVVTPDMPWSQSRAYDRTLSDAQREIDAAVQGLRMEGATKMVIAGHSMGANMAIAYAATHSGVDAVMALGPGQTVEAERFREELGPSVAKAEALIGEGKADEVTEFKDLHLGNVSTIRATPRIYDSYFNPRGLANMPVMVRQIAVPFLWTVGDRDKNMLDRGAGYAFERSGGNPSNRYAIVSSDHMGTPTASRAVALDWLSTVFPR